MPPGAVTSLIVRIGLQRGFPAALAAGWRTGRPVDRGERGGDRARDPDPRAGPVGLTRAAVRGAREHAGIASRWTSYSVQSLTDSPPASPHQASFFTNTSKTRPCSSPLA